MRKPLVTIENWAVIQRGTYSAYEKLQPGRSLVGNVFGHTSLPDTEFIYTSPILRVHPTRGLVETVNTVYQLGEASNDYKSWEHDRGPEAAA
jgi:hypothetical protein